MTKTINIKDIKILDITLAMVGNDYVLSVAYSLLDEDNKEWSPRRITIKDLKVSEKLKVGVFMTLIKTILKTKENL